MNNITYKFDVSKENKEFIEHNLELYNFSKNEWLNPIIYKREERKFGFYAYVGNDIIGGEPMDLLMMDIGHGLIYYL